MNQDPNFDRLIAEALEASRDNRTEAALALFAQASAVAPASGIPHFLAGSEHASAGNIELAEAAFARAVLLAPAFALARYQLGLLQFSSQRPAMALVTWQPLFDLPGADPLGHFVRGFEALARDSFAEALEHYREGLACNDINQAMASDILQVVTAVEKLPRGEPPAADPDARHVLLAGYAKRLH
ncbi:MAG: Tetratricopeptide domain protein [Ramlibacter sp.]|nr:Tetratricopeptide domain protein [Ramlibacter sp.]